jgi:hypothetical protein
MQLAEGDEETLGASWTLSEVIISWFRACAP